MKTAPNVRDAVAVGVPDEKFGQAIVAMVELAPGAELDEGEIITPREGQARRRSRRPSACCRSPTIGRAANGKVDYKRLTSEATERVGVPS